MPSHSPLTAQLDSHELRIQRLEENVLDMVSDVAQMKAKVDGLDEKMDSMDRKLDRILDAVDKHDDRLTALESSEGSRKGWFKWVAGIVASVAVAYFIAAFGLK